MQSQFEELLQARVGPLGRTELSLLFQHYQILRTWNHRMNLTTVIELEAAVTRHYAESVFLASLVPIGVRTAIDVGSGAGFPGVPLAIVRPDIEVVLLESIAKKCTFLKEAVRELKNVKVAHSRAESFESSADVIVSRAVSPVEIASFVPRLGPNAFMLMAAADATPPWRIIAELPWNSASVIAGFHVEHRLC